MTSKIYKSAQGKSIDLGTIMLQNEHVRAVGNMKVNARGDKLDSSNQVIETKPQQIQRQNSRTTTAVDSGPIHTSLAKAKQAKQGLTPDTVLAPVETVDPTPVDTTPVDTTPTIDTTPVDPTPTVDTIPTQAVAPDNDPSAEQAIDNAPTKGAGLAGAIARTRQIKQELDRTRRQQAQDSGVKKI